ncbi:unnamed protein product [marine sediment metagenome]|uniref:Uncharacterized protein n=1 Tax=marine sediment metagenome TaxID=412755 RepID=X1HAQ3_9ZZZZ
MATWEQHMSGVSTEHLQSKIIELKDIIAMKKAGASRSELMQKYGYYPDNPEGTILAYQKLLASRGVIVEKTQQAGIFSNKNITIAIVAIIAVILIKKL